MATGPWCGTIEATNRNSISHDNRPHLYHGKDRKTYVGFGEQPKIMELDTLLPESLRGMSYDEVTASKAVGQFFQLADLVLASANAMAAHVKTLNVSGATESSPVKTQLPSADLDYLRARNPDGSLSPQPMIDLFSIVAAYWDDHGAMAIEPGLVANLWRRGMKAEDIIRCIQASTGKDGKMIKASGRGHDIMQTVIAAYLEAKGLSRDAELPQTEMADLVERWLTATRSVPLGSNEAANSVLHWAEYRRLGLIDDAGAAQPEQVRLIASKVFSIKGQLTFKALSAWVAAYHPPKTLKPSPATKAARTLLKKKRKQGKLNRKRGRR